MADIPEWRATRTPKRVVGYHGCHIDVARRVVDGEPLQHSVNEYDWLGSGVYFWEYAPDRAYEWARARFEENAAVIEATITLGNCVNLRDSTHFERLRQAYQDVVSTLQEERLPLPANRGGRHLLDRLVIDNYCKLYTDQTDDTYDTVRSCFPEGEPVFEGSKILRYTHVQIAVLDCERCISSVKLVHFISE